MLKRYNIMEDIINNIDSYPLLNKYFNLISDDRKSRYLTAIKNLKRNKLYSTPIHGVYHSEKVSLFAYLLGIEKGCSERELEMLLDACLYHDFKRESDREDSFHGYSSALHLEEVVDRNKYNDREFSIIKCMIDYHCLPTCSEKFNIAMDDFSVDDGDREECLLLSNILKDADALDRKRFPDVSCAALNEDYLIYPESHELIGLSEEINEAYRGMTIKEDDILANPYLSYDGRGSCLHSIGKNVFKINSILDNGLLSYSRLLDVNKNLPRNFCGGNTDKWISVVPVSILEENGSAKEEFLDKGLVFVYEDVDLYSVDDRVNASYAYSYGLPYKKNNGYKDERYAFLGIPADKLVMIFVGRGVADKDLCELDHYVYDSLSYDLFVDNIKYYLNKMDLLDSGELPYVFNNDLAEYRRVQDEYKNRLGDADVNTQEYIDRLGEISSKINRMIGKYLHNYYALMLNKDSDERVTFNDAVCYELNCSNYNYDMVDAYEMIYIIKGNNKVYSK